MGQNKNAQLKIQQMAFMLMAVFIFFALAVLFCIVFQSRNVTNIANELERTRATEISASIAETAEFSCGSFCVDGDRMMVLANKTKYGNFWQVSSIEVRTVYPTSTQEILCTASNYPDCNYIRVYDNGEGKIKASSFVSLAKRVNEGGSVYTKYEVAQLIVGYTSNV